MAQVASGSVNDRPFARTVFSLAAKRFTGDLIMRHRQRETKVVWSDGQIVAAHSVSPADALGRQALTHGLINSSMLGSFLRRQEQEPKAEPIKLLAEVANLSVQQCVTIKHHVFVRSAARIFALPNAVFVVNNEPSLAPDPELPALDVRWLIYFGLRTHYPMDRLEDELSVIGSRTILLSKGAVPMLPAFGFGDTEQLVLAPLQEKPTTLARLEALGLDTQISHCVVYALLACGYIEYGAGAEGRKKPRQTKQTLPPDLSGPTVKDTSFVAARLKSKSTAPPLGPSKDPTSTSDTIAVVKEKLRVLSMQGNHYDVLGLGSNALASEISASYFQLARRLHPDRLQALGIDELKVSAQTVFAAINKAFQVLSNAKDRAQYEHVIAAGGEKAYAAEQKKAGAIAAKILEAEEHFRVGEMALRRDQFGTAVVEFSKACELNPDESEYQALFAWATYCHSKDRSTIESDVLKRMSSALLQAPNNIPIRLHHARLLKLMGRKKDAIESFRELLRISPDHHEAELELRLLSERRKLSTGFKKGLFGR